MNIKKLWYLLFALMVFSSCEKEEELTAPIFKEQISGFVQKGPFLNGTSLLISEYDKKLVATGKNFTTQISDNSGTFAINDVELKSPFVSLKADGFYFNEVSGLASTAPITLYAITDLSDKSMVNVNVLSYLEKSRTEFLVGEGMEFAAAKQQAQKEVLAIFEIEKAGISNSESLDISQEGDDNAILLAVSVILQGNRSEGQLSELMANIITDIKEDGTVDDPAYGSALLNGLKNLSLDMVRKNVEDRYKSLGITTAIGDFEKYVQDFISNTDFVHIMEFGYPEFASHLNILWMEDGSSLETKGSQSIYSLAASVPDNSSLRVVMKKIEGDWTIHSNPGHWEIQGSSSEGMSELKSLKSGELLNASVEFSQKGSCLLEIYEGDATEPTITKTIHWNSNFIFTYPETGQYGPNLMALPNLPEENKILPGEYSFAITLPDDKDYEVEIRIDEGYFENIRIDREKIQNWEYTPIDNGIILRVSGRGITADMSFTLLDMGHMAIQSLDFGEEIKKQVNWDDPNALNDNNFKFKYPLEGKYGKNLLGFPDGVTNTTPGEYSLAVFIPDFKDYAAEFTIIINSQGPINIDPEKVQHWEYELILIRGREDSYTYELILNYTGRGVIPDMPITVEGMGSLHTLNHQKSLNVYWE